MTQTQEQALVYCEACNLPHRAGIVHCQGCGHTLGETPNWDEVRNKARFHKRMSVAAAGVSLICLVLTIVVIGEGSPFYALLPLIWLGFHLYQLFTLHNRIPIEE